MARKRLKRNVQRAMARRRRGAKQSKKGLVKKQSLKKVSL